MLTDNKILKLSFRLFSILCIIAAAVCLIVNLAINKSITWAGYPLIAIPFTWVVVLPLMLLKKHKTIFSLIVFSILTLPLLYCMERLTPVKEWFAVLGVPVAVTGIIAVWITYLLLKYVKVNFWYISAALVFLYGVVASFIVNYFVNIFLGNALINLSGVINIISSVAVTVLLVIIGQNKSMNEKLKRQQEDI